jgi:hypothetical protein
MKSRGSERARSQLRVGDPAAQKRAVGRTKRFRGGCALFVAAFASLMAAGSPPISGLSAAGASPSGIVVNCPADDLQNAINSAPAGSTLLLQGTCTGNFYVDESLTLSGPATLDGGGIATTYGATLNVIAGTVVLNNLTIQDGVGIDNLGGGLWNSGQLTLNHSTVAHNTAYAIGGIFNMGALTLNSSTVSHNTATNGGGGGIYNCGANSGFQDFGLCTGTPGNLTLNRSSVSDNAAGSGNGGGIANDPHATLNINGSTVSDNTTSGNGGGIENDGTATLTLSTVSGNTGGSGGGVMDTGTATFNLSAISDNSSTTGSNFFGNGGGLSLSSTASATLNYSIIHANSAVFVGGGIFAGGPLNINESIVTGNSAGPTGGGMVVWNGLTTVTRSAFSHNSDQSTIPDSLPGVLIASADSFGLGNNPSFTTTHSTYN